MVERTMQFILHNLASVTARQEAMAARQQEAEARAAAHEAYTAAMERRLDRRMEGILKLIKTGMRMIVEVQEAQKRTEEKIAELAAAQKRTDQRFDRWLDSLKGVNGHKKRSR